MKALVIQHVVSEPPSTYLDSILNDRWTVETVLHSDDAPIPVKASDFDAVIVMGGPMSAVEPSKWRSQEFKFIREAVLGHEIPLLGICLGAQLLAGALGGYIYHGEVPEVGFEPLNFTDEGVIDPVVEPLLYVEKVLQWHSDTMTLPNGAQLLASSSDYANQVFRFGRAYGFQCHLEVTDLRAREWLLHESYAGAIDATIGDEGIEDMLAELRSRQIELLACARDIGRAWISETSTK